MKVEIYNTFEQVENIWREFENHADMYVFQKYDWVKNWYDSIGQADHIQLLITLVRHENDEIIFLLPLGIKKISFIRCLVWLGGHVSDYHAPLLSRKEDLSFDFNQVMDLLMKEFRSRVDIIFWEKEPGIIGDRINPFTQWKKSELFSVNGYFVQLESEWEVFQEKKIKKNIRTDSNRKRRRLEELGKIRFQIAEGRNDKIRFTEKMIEQKTDQYKRTGAYNIFKYNQYKQFYLTMGQCENTQKWKLHISALLLNGEIIAVHWGLYDEERFYWLMSSYTNTEISKYSPGRLLLLELLQWCCRENLKIFDFTIGGEMHKKDWCDRELMLYKHVIPLNYRGVIFRILYQLKMSMKQNPVLYSVAKKIKNFIK